MAYAFGSLTSPRNFSNRRRAGWWAQEIQAGCRGHENETSISSSNDVQGCARCSTRGECCYDLTMLVLDLPQLPLWICQDMQKLLTTPLQDKVRKHWLDDGCRCSHSIPHRSSKQCHLACPSTVAGPIFQIRN